MNPAKSWATCVAAIISTLAPTAFAAQIGIVGMTVQVKGAIAPGDEKAFARAAKSIRTLQPEMWITDLDSSGGDVDTAMAIGRIIRAGDGAVATTTACSSACVLVYAAGVRRAGANLNVHRVFFSSLKPGLSQTQVKAAYDAELERVRVYLKEMDVAPELMSFMQSFSPEDMHRLTSEEVERFGLGGTDPIYDERKTAAAAALYGLSSYQFREKSIEAKQQCEKYNSDSIYRRHAQEQIDWVAKGGTQDSFRQQDKDQLLAEVQAADRLSDECRNGVMLAIPMSEMHTRMERANVLCEKIRAGEERERCSARVWRTGG